MSQSIDLPDYLTYYQLLMCLNGKFSLVSNPDPLGSNLFTSLEQAQQYQILAMLSNTLPNVQYQLFEIKWKVKKENK